MYTIAKLPKTSLDFLNKVASAGAQRTPHFQIALGYVLARRLSLPTEAVTDIQTYFRLQHQTVVEALLGDLNEILPYPTKVVLENVRAFYYQRYRSVNPPEVNLAQIPETGVEDFFGLSTVFPKDFFAILREDPAKVTMFVVGLTTLFNTLPRPSTEASTDGRTEYVA